jgi:hypothetical protein
MFVSGAALALASCGRPDEQVIPYVEMPEGEIPGIPTRFASALPLNGYGRGVIITSVEGRPIKIDGKARHRGEGASEGLDRTVSICVVLYRFITIPFRFRQ